jgi:hypothetical protein
MFITELFLDELGNAPAEYQPNRKRKRSLFHATVDGHWVDVFFDRSELNDTLHITFAVDGNYEASDQPTKASKSAVKILSTVLNIVKQKLPEYIAKARPPAVSFTAKEDNRSGLYRKYFVPVIQNILGSKWAHEEFPSMNMTVFNWKPVNQIKEITLDPTVTKYKEIEFVCVNPGFKDATNNQAQAKLYQFLKKVPGVIPLWQDWSHIETGQKSLTAIYKDPAVRSTIIKAANTLGIAVDLEQDVDSNYVDRAVRGEHEGQINEITAVPTVAKSKRQHLDVMPNDGKPITQGEEDDYLGEFVSKMPGGYELWSWNSRWDRTYFVFDPKTRISQLATTGKQYPENPDSFVVLGLYSGPKNQVRAADLYAFLIRHLGLTLVSDNKQSEGGYRVWQELERRYGKTINVHGFDTKTDTGVNVTTQDEPDTHVARADVKRAGPQGKKELATISRDLRFVASAR